MDWRAYQQEVFARLKDHYADSVITHDVHLQGKSGVRRQIDTLIESFVADAEIRIVVDAKYRSSPVDINEVEAFVSMISDLSAHRGILVASTGYTTGALARAHNEHQNDIELDVLSLDELHLLQGECAIPYSGAHGIIMRAPFGWIIDATRREGVLATSYQRGRNFETAEKAKEFMYFQVRKKDAECATLHALIVLQNTTMRNANIEILSAPPRADARTKIRSALIEGYPTIEYTGFVEFEDFFFFAVLFCPPETTKQCLRKLRELLRTVQPIYIRNDGAA
jgi:Restriction endonuclease